MLDFDVSEFSKFVSRLFMMVSSAEFEDVWGTVVDVGIMGLPIFKWQKSNKSDVHHQFSTFEPYLNKTKNLLICFNFLKSFNQQKFLIDNDDVTYFPSV